MVNPVSGSVCGGKTCNGEGEVPAVNRAAACQRVQENARTAPFSYWQHNKGETDLLGEQANQHACCKAEEAWVYVRLVRHRGSCELCM
eukprot:g3873.t1